MEAGGEGRGPAAAARPPQEERASNSVRELGAVFLGGSFALFRNAGSEVLVAAVSWFSRMAKLPHGLGTFPSNLSANRQRTIVASTATEQQPLDARSTVGP